jgi:DUF4097 and DUF4098 domain-containing protein YvlB
MNVITIGMTVAAALAVSTAVQAQTVVVDLHDALAVQREVIQAALAEAGQRIRREMAMPQAAPVPPWPSNPPNPRPNPRPPREPRQRFNLGPEYTETFSKTVRLGNSGRFELSNISGDVTITGGGGQEVRIQATKRVHERSQSDADQVLRALAIEVVEGSGFVQVRSEGVPSRRNAGASIDYNVAVPNGAAVSLRTLSGNVRVSNIKGELRVESTSGDIAISSATRLRQLKAISGNVDLTDIEGDDIVTNVWSGDVGVRNLKARSLDMEGISGDLRLVDAQCDRVNLKTLSGDIEYSGRLARNGRYDVQSHSGDVRLTPLGNAAFEFEASTFNGDIRSDFTTNNPSVASSAFAGRRPVNRTVRGSVGQGGAIVSLRSFSGDVLIVKR